MSIRLAVTMVAVAALAAAAPVVRGDEDKAGQRKGDKGHGRHGDPSDDAIAPSRDTKFRDWDKDGNGSLSREEYPGHPGNFRALDTDNDGSLSVEEFHHRSGPGAPPDARADGAAVRDSQWRAARDEEFRRFDGDDDGVLTRGEWRGRPSAFDGMDADRNGVVTRDEYARGAGRARLVK